MEDAKTLTEEERKSRAEQLEDYHSDIESAKDGEQEKYDNMPESLQNGEKGERLNEAIEHLETAESALQEAINTLESEDWKAEEAEPESLLSTVIDECDNAINAIEDACNA